MIALELVGLALVAGLLVLNVCARLDDRRWRKAGRGWRLPCHVRPLARFKAKARFIQWGEFTNVRSGRVGELYGQTEPEVVEYRDFASFIRLWPNPGFTVAGRHWCRSRTCPTPWKVG